MSRNFWLHHLAAALVAVAFITVLRAMGDFGSENQDLAVTAAHSAVIVLCTFPVQTLFAVSFMQADYFRASPAMAAVLGCVLAAVPVSFLSPVASWLLGVLPRNLSPQAGRDDFLADLASRYPFVLLGFAIVGPVMWMALNYSWWRERLARAAGRDGDASLGGPGPADPQAPEAMLISKLPQDRRGPIVALSAERHYVRVITEAGEDLVLMRFSDAVTLCEALDGLQVHRSHWVRKSAIQDVQKRAGRIELLLPTGHAVPVSRSYEGAVRGLIPAT
jgi:hypothetical protein